MLTLLQSKLNSPKDSESIISYEEQEETIQRPTRYCMKNKRKNTFKEQKAYEEPVDTK